MAAAHKEYRRRPTAPDDTPTPVFARAARSFGSERGPNGTLLRFTPDDVLYYEGISDVSKISMELARVLTVEQFNDLYEPVK